MALLQNTAEGGTNGTTVTTANSGGVSGDAWGQVEIGGTSTLTFTSAQAQKGTLSYAVSGVAAAITVLNWLPVNSTQVVFRAYLRLTGYPSAGQNFIRFMNNGGTAQRAAIVMDTAGGIRIHDVNAIEVLGGSSLPEVLAVDTWYRIEISLDTPTILTGAMVLKVFAGDSLTPLTGFNLNPTGQNFGTGGVARIRFGKATSGGTWATQYWDDIAFQDATLTLLGPSSAPGGPVALDGSAPAASSATGSLAATRPLSGSAPSASAATGALAAARPLSGTAPAASGATGVLALDRPLTGASPSAASATGALSAARPFSGASSAASSATGTLTLERPLTAVAASAAALDGVASVERALTAAAASAASATAELTVTAAAVPDPNPVTITVTDTGHTATLADAGHTATARETSHSVAVADQGHTATIRDTGHTVTVQERR